MGKNGNDIEFGVKGIYLQNHSKYFKGQNFFLIKKINLFVEGLFLFSLFVLKIHCELSHPSLLLIESLFSYIREIGETNSITASAPTEVLLWSSTITSSPPSLVLLSLFFQTFLNSKYERTQNVIHYQLSFSSCLCII